MEAEVRILQPGELVEKLPALLEYMDAVPLVISGNSMAPFLIHGRDTVYLSKVTRPLKRGDMVFYRRRNGQCVLHRICCVEQGSYALVGDAQRIIEYGITREQILAVVTAVRRRGKLLKPGCFWWEFFEKVWLRLIPARRTLTAAYSKMTGK